MRPLIIVSDIVNSASRLFSPLIIFDNIMGYLRWGARLLKFHCFKTLDVTIELIRPMWRLLVKSTNVISSPCSLAKSLKAKIIGEGNAAQKTYDEFAEWYFLKGNEDEIKHKEFCEVAVEHLRQSRLHV